MMIREVTGEAGHKNFGGSRISVLISVSSHSNSKCMSLKDTRKSKSSAR